MCSAHRKDVVTTEILSSALYTAVKHAKHSITLDHVKGMCFLSCHLLFYFNGVEACVFYLLSCMNLR